MPEISLLFTCNQWKERSSMRPVGAADNHMALAALAGGQILDGNMDYRRKPCRPPPRKRGYCSTADRATPHWINRIYRRQASSFAA